MSHFLSALYTSHDLLSDEELRVITCQRGFIVDINDAFARTMGMTRDDLTGRKLLDNVIFENYDDLFDGLSALNQSLLQSGDELHHFKIGNHKILIGQEQNPVIFHFDWIKSRNGHHYLVGSSFKQSGVQDLGEGWDWSDFMANLPDRADTRQDNNAVYSASTYLPLNADDMATFSSLNTDILCIIDQNGHILRDNGHKNLKNSHDQAFNTLSEAIYDEDQLIFIQNIDQIIDKGAQSVTFEARLKSKDPRKAKWVSWHIEARGHELFCLGHDITTAKTTELSLKRREQELSEAQALALMGHWRWSVGAAELEWSDQIYNIFGVSKDDFTPTLDNTNALLHKRDIGHMMQAFQRAIIEQNDYDIDFRVVRQDGSIGYVRCEGRCELDDDGDVIALYGVMQDITEQTEHEMELHAAKDAAEQAYASKSRFLANMSHELRTPLNAIIGFSDMIERQMLGAIGNEKYLEYATNIKDSGEHLLSLISDILDMSKIEAGKYELDLEKIALGDVVNSAVRMIESRAQEGVITLENTNDGCTDPIIIADRRAVMQIMLNILSNAVKFTEPGGRITLSIEEFDQHVSVIVKDTGIGIPANKLSAVLRPFEQVSTEFTRNHEGSGLGLAITKELAELHGGTVTLESKENEGTTAQIRLPLDASKKQKA